MTLHQRAPCPQDSDPEEAAVDTPIIRLADHAIGLWQAAQELDDPVLVEALRPLVIHVARSLARDIMEDVAGETAH